MTDSREVLLKGKDQYSWPPCTNKFRSAPFNIEKIINIFYKTSYLNEEVNCTENSRHLVFPADSDKHTSLLQTWYQHL